MCNQRARTICVDASTLPFSIHFAPRVFTELPSVFGFISISVIHSVTERQIRDDTTWNQHLNSSESNLPAEDGAWWASVFVRRRWNLIHQVMLNMLLKFNTTGRISSEFDLKALKLIRSQPSYHLDLFLPDHQAALSSCWVQPGPGASTSRYLALGSQHLTFGFSHAEHSSWLSTWMYSLRNCSGFNSVNHYSEIIIVMVISLLSFSARWRFCSA